MQDPDLWQRLQAFEFDADDAEKPFSAKLAEEEKWTEAHARNVIEEYRRFLYLAAISGEQATPSEDIDRAWHMHLSYTRSYWEALCDGVLGRRLHHEPSKGPREKQRFARQYRATRALYADEFGMRAPGHIWQGESEIIAMRWGGNVVGLAGVGLIALWFLEAAGPLSRFGYPILLVLAVGGGILYMLNAPRGRRSSDSADCGGGGCGGD